MAVRGTTITSALLDEHLPGWDYADAYETGVGAAPPQDALTATRCLLSPSGPGRRLLQARDLVARRLGLRPAVTGAPDLFPVLYATPELAVVGLDDEHLDFRVLTELTGAGVRCTTVVRRHNALGHAYFGVVAPFHRRLVPRLLARAAERGWATPPQEAGLPHG